MTNLVIKGFGSKSIVTKGFATGFVEFIYKLGRRILNLTLFRKESEDLNRSALTDLQRYTYSQTSVNTSLNTKRVIDIHGN